MGDGLWPDGSIDVAPHPAHLGNQVPFAFQFAEQLGGKLKIPLSERLLRALKTRPRPGAAEDLDRLVPGGLLEQFTKLASRGKAVCRLLGHSLVDHLADRRV